MKEIIKRVYLTKEQYLKFLGNRIDPAERTRMANRIFNGHESPHLKTIDGVRYRVIDKLNSDRSGIGRAEMVGGNTVYEEMEYTWM